MSKYKQSGAYHFAEWENMRSPYRKHIIGIIQSLVRFGVFPRSALDLGCGEGLLLARLNEIGIVDTAGWEVDEYAIKLAKQRDLPVIKRDMTILPWKLPAWGMPDVIFALDSLEHIPASVRQDVISECFKHSPRLIASIPSAKDPYACGVQPSKSEFKGMLARAGWAIAREEDKHVRHTFWCRWPE